MKTLAPFPEPRADRHATMLAHDEPSCRVVCFTLAPRQAVPVHTSRSSVVVTVISGSGMFSGGDTHAALIAGETAVYAPDEPHGMIAGPEGLSFLAVITPSPAHAGGH